MQVRTLDLETELTARARLAPPPVCAAWYDGQDTGLELIADAIQHIEAWLRSGEILVGTNLAFDFAVIGEYAPDLLPLIFAKYDAGQIHCIDINQKIIDIASRGGTDDSYSLESLSVRYDQPVLDKSSPWRTEFASLKAVPVRRWPEGAVTYVLGDVKNPYHIHRAQFDYAKTWEERSGKPLLHLAGQEAYKQFVLYLISCWGIMADEGRVKLLREALEKRMDEAATDLKAAGLVRPDGSKDTKAAKERMRAALGDRCQLTKTGDISLNKEACDEAAVHDPLLQAYSDYSQAATLRSRVEDMAQGVCLPLQPRFNSLLETSRTSASKPEPPIVGVQVQNFPRMVSFARDEKGKRIKFPIGAREALTPRPGHAFVIADYSIAELHSLAQVCLDLFGKSVMAEQLNAGKDVHSWFGGLIVGLEYEEVLRRIKEPEIKLVRDQAKPCNFGFPGGMGPDKFVMFAYMTYKIRFDVERARHLKQVWLAAFPEMAEYFKYIDRLFKGRDYALFVHLRSGRWRGRVPFCAACNSQFQELTATGAASALCEVQRQCYTVKSSDLYESRVVMFTHDEIVAESPLDRAHEAAIALGRVMEERFNQYHPDCPTKADPLVTMIYSKEAKPVIENGRFVPWRLSA